ncbi:MAG: Aeromonas phage [Bacteroidota bacterium]|jgi:hypothetical protein
MVDEFNNDDKPVYIYHATTPKKAKAYRGSGAIHKPIRGFNTPIAAMAWAIKVSRNVILEIEVKSLDKIHKLPDHHNKFGEAYWIDEDIKCSEYKCFYSAGSCNDHL